MMVVCPTCGTENAENGAFCIECGAPLRAIAVGSTERLPQAADGKRCQFCDTLNPLHARFCVNCGRTVDGTPHPVATATAPSYAPPSYAPPANLALPDAPLQPTAKRFSRRNRAVWSGLSGGVFLIGLALLFATKLFWPGILVLIGVSSLISAFYAGEPEASISGGVFMIGLAVLFAFNLFWPGILVLVGMTAIFHALFGKAMKRSGS